jgi:hypothetical protein
MAKKRMKSGQSQSSYFRKLFTEKPRWLNQTSNDEVVARFRTDHKLAADADIGKSAKQTMANVKSLMRKALREGGGKVPKMNAAFALAAGPVPKSTGKPRLDHLEELIDDCMATAKELDRQGLDHIIRLLRHARNEVVWKMGQKA